MYVLKLIKGLSYTGVVSATVERPIVMVEDEARARKALASGYFEQVKGPDPAPAPEPDPPAPEKDTTTPGENTDSKSDDTETPPPAPEGGEGQGTAEKPLEEMKLEELLAYAKAHDYDLGGATRKADVLQRIKEIEADAAAAAALLGET